MHTAREISQAKRAARKALVIQSSRMSATATRDAARRTYGNAIRDVSRDASRRGVIHNTPIKVNAGGYVISTAATQSL
ncbi:hypothetical protein ACEQUB_p01092 (plasmid) [Ralstonia syzygii]|uniref:Uncharacterized protein n=1 Tax=Ralstonia syzygii R24 TaxID=907261 RepID=G3AC82_9RALS|nr:hypothetical protein RALSY_mp30480 [Ralstonia syzygii R24]